VKQSVRFWEEDGQESSVMNELELYGVKEKSMRGLCVTRL